jgi:hypothetical protein
VQILVVDHPVLGVCVVHLGCEVLRHADSVEAW